MLWQFKQRSFSFFAPFEVYFGPEFEKKTGPGFVSMSSDLKRLINMKRKEVKFRVIKKVVVSFTVKVNLKERPLHTIFL